MTIKPHTPVASAWVNLAAEYEAQIMALKMRLHNLNCAPNSLTSR